MTRSADAVIIGAGVIGSALAFELAKLGYRTLNVDKLPAAGYGSTSSSSAVVRAHYSTRAGVAMAYEGFSYWANWADYLEIGDEAGLASFANCGSVLLKSDDGLYPKALGHYRDLGVEHEDWDTETLRQAVPYYDLSRFWPPSRPDADAFWAEPAGELPGAVYTPGSGYMSDPQLATHNLQVAAEAKGATFVFRRRVVDLLGDSAVRGVALDDGEVIEAPIVVNVAGPHSRDVNRLAGVEAGMKIKTRPLRHEVHVLPGPRGVDLAADGFHTADGDLGIYFRPESGNTIVVGSEDPPCDPREWADDPDEFNRLVTASHWETQAYRLAKRIPSLQVPTRMRGVADLYDVSDDWMPIYDASDRPGYFMAIGSSGNQFKNAPVAGNLMACLIDASVNGTDHDADPVQVKGRFTGLTLDSGAFSRNREVNEYSSFSVNG
ncbi:MAG: NAD(P)/FAD-dependent oxidoreductase [Acidimicrobiales bacterium]